jgi:membrane-bound serine protease (ClpP class)
LKAIKHALFFIVILTAISFSSFALVSRIDLNKAIHPLTEEYVCKAIAEANAKNADLILIVMDTPGGYIKNVETIQRAIMDSKAPVAVFVCPAGARAASGGALVAVASDFIAMAPGTTIGSAHPVSGLPIPVSPADPDKKDKKGDDVMMEKVINDLTAHLRSIASIRGRSPEPIENMVRMSISLTEKEALEQKVIEMVAGNETELLSRLAGQKLKRFDGSFAQLPAQLGQVETIKMTFRQKALSSIADPEIAFLLLMIGALGLFIEFKSPGLIFPGIIGGIAALLYLLSLPILPVNVVGILLIMLGLVFFILEIKVVSYGMLGIGGTISLIIGALMLYRGNPLTGEGLRFSFILPVVLAFAAIFGTLVYLAVKAFKNPVMAGAENMIGRKAVVHEAINPPDTGKVFVFGEYWTAESEIAVENGKTVKVVGYQGMVLRVEPLK